MWSGRIAPLLLLLLTLYFDPLSAFSAKGAIEGSWIPVSLCFFGGVAIYLLFGKPQVKVSQEGSLYVINPLSSWEVPSGDIKGFSDGFFHPAVVTLSGRTIRLWGLEESLLGKISGCSALHNFTHDHQTQPSQSSERTVKKCEQMFDAFLLSLSGGYISYLVATFIS